MSTAKAPSPAEVAAWRADLQRERTSARRPASRVIADLFDDIDQAIRSGVSRARVLELLAQRGLQVTMALLDKCLYRLRRRRRDAGIEPPERPSRSGVASPASHLFSEGKRPPPPADRPQTTRPSLLARARAFAGIQAQGGAPTPAQASAAMAPDRHAYQHLTEAEAARLIDEARLRRRPGKA